MPDVSALLLIFLTIVLTRVFDDLLWPPFRRRLARFGRRWSRAWEALRDNDEKDFGYSKAGAWRPLMLAREHKRSRRVLSTNS